MTSDKALKPWPMNETIAEYMKNITIPEGEHVIAIHYHKAALESVKVFIDGIRAFPITDKCRQ